MDSSARSVFLSYRREDSAGHTGRLHDRFTARWGAERVFFDIDNIPPGEDFIHVIDRTLDECVVVVVVVGSRWLEVRDSAGARRIDGEADFHRLELERALQRGIRVLPVLVGNAQMPKPGDLPASLAAFARRNAFEISDKRFGQDAAKLGDVIEDVIEQQRQRLENERKEQELQRRNAEVAQREAARQQRLDEALARAEEKRRQEQARQKLREARRRRPPPRVPRVTEAEWALEFQRHEQLRLLRSERHWNHEQVMTMHAERRMAEWRSIEALRR